jgi:predicted CoA-binding protein
MIERNHMSSRTAIEAFLAQPTLALVGMSRSGKNFGNLAYRALAAKGYHIYPIHPNATIIGGVGCYRNFAALPEHVENLLVVVPPAEAVTVVRNAAAAGIRRVWLQQGSESREVLFACRDLGLDVISGECILMFARPTGYHKAHHWLWGLLGKLPA